jgi:hypothetical protein
MLDKKLRHEYAFDSELLKECSMETHTWLDAEVEALHAKGKMKGLDLQSLTNISTTSLLPVSVAAVDSSAASEHSSHDSTARPLADLIDDSGFGQVSFNLPTSDELSRVGFKDLDATLDSEETRLQQPPMNKTGLKNKARRKSTVLATTQSHQQATAERKKKLAQQAAKDATENRWAAEWVQSARVWPENRCVKFSTATGEVTAEGRTDGDVTPVVPRRRRSLTFSGALATSSARQAIDDKPYHSHDSTRMHQSADGSDVDVLLAAAAEKDATAPAQGMPPPSLLEIPAGYDLPLDSLSPQAKPSDKADYLTPSTNNGFQQYRSSRSPLGGDCVTSQLLLRTSPNGKQQQQQSRLGGSDRNPHPPQTKVGGDLGFARRAARRVEAKHALGRDHAEPASRNRGPLIILTSCRSDFPSLSSSSPTSQQISEFLGDTALSIKSTDAAPRTQQQAASYTSLPVIPGVFGSSRAPLKTTTAHFGVSDPPTRRAVNQRAAPRNHSHQPRAF